MVSPVEERSAGYREIAVIDRDVLPWFALGASLFGSGGGGRLEVATALAEIAMNDHPAVPVTPARALPPDTWVAHVAVLGAPLAMSEKLPTGVEFALCAAALANKMGVELGAISCLSVGGANALLGLLTAVHLGLPLVDGDVMGRAFPRLEQTVLTAAGRNASPLGLMCPKGNFVLVETDSQIDAGRIAGGVAVEMGGWAALTVYLVQASALADEGHTGTVSRAVWLGRALSDVVARPQERTPAELAGALGADLLFDGTIVDIRQARVGEPAVVVLTGGGEDAQVARVDMMQEYLVVAVDGRVRATVPDLICLVTTAGVVLDQEALRLGQRAVVLRMPCEPKWREPGALALVAPRAFGIDVDEELSGSAPAGCEPGSTLNETGRLTTR